MIIAVIVLNWNGKKDTLACIDSLQKQSYRPYEIIVVDNGSTDGSVQQIRSLYPSVTLLENQENLGFAGGNNRGITYALEKGFDAIVLLNNDTIVDPSFLHAFASTSQKHPHSLLGAKIYVHSNPNLFDHFGGNWNPAKGQFDLIGYHQQEDNISWEKPFPLDYICGCALFAKAEAFKAIGLLDERFFLFWEEADFCYRAKQLGFSVFCAPQAKVWHKVSASFTGGKPHTTYFWWRNRLLWIQKHLPSKEQKKLYRTTLIPEIFKLLRHYLLFSLRLTITYPKNAPRYLKYRKEQVQVEAALFGVTHYFLRRFYQAPLWIVDPSDCSLS